MTTQDNAALQSAPVVPDGKGVYAGWKAKSRAHAIARMLDFHGDKASERVVEINEILSSAPQYDGDKND